MELFRFVIVRVLLLVTALRAGNATGDYYLEKKSCGQLFSKRDLSGATLLFNDRDQSLNLEEDHHYLWNTTGSIKIESGCSLEICNDTYLQGTCDKLKQGSIATVSTLSVPSIASAKCACHKECKCSDIFMKQNSCGNGYFEGGCSTCHSDYTDFFGDQVNFPSEFIGKVEAIRLREGCNLTLFEEEDFEGDSQVITDYITEGFSSSFQSYKCACDPTKIIYRVRPPRPIPYPPLIEIPGTMDAVTRMMRRKEYFKHPGLRAALQSLRTGSSSKNAYILVLGSTGSGKSSTINLLFDSYITKVGAAKSTTTNIDELRIPVPIDEIGVANSELRIIDTPGVGDTRGLLQDAKFLATLDAYLATHEELSERKPNAILVFHKFTDNRFDGVGASFVKTLRGLNSFRTKITDDKFSNVIFVLTHFCSGLKSDQKRPSTVLNQFKSVIENYSLFPKPIIITVAENKAKEQELKMINGFYKLPNKDLYPKNLFRMLELITEKREDSIGLGVFRSAFRDSQDFNVSHHPFQLLHDSSKVDYYFQILSHAFFQINRTEISTILADTWGEKMDKDLKRKCPDSLPYLQKALAIRNINKKIDVPRTSTGILELLMVIRQDNCTQELLSKGLEIVPPKFPRDTIAGYSYDVFKDTALPISPYKISDLRGSDTGFMIPKALTCKLDPSTKQRLQVLGTQEEYITQRVNSLGIDIKGKIPKENFKGAVKPGYNIREISFNENGCTVSATQEIRLFNFKLNEELEFTPEFVTAVRSLPAFNQNDYKNVEIWKAFFATYGTHVVDSVHGGGAIQITLQSTSQYRHELQKALENLMDFTEDTTFMEMNLGGDTDEHTDGGEGYNKTLIPAGVTYSLAFHGGNTEYHTNSLSTMSLDMATQLLAKWKKSLNHNPTMLESEMKLIPISRIVRKLGQHYSSQIEITTSLLYNANLTYVPISKVPIEDIDSRSNTPTMNELLQQRAIMKEEIQQLRTEMYRMQLSLQMGQQNLSHWKQIWEAEMLSLRHNHSLALVELATKANIGRTTEIAENEKDKARNKQDLEAATRIIEELKRELDRRPSPEIQAQIDAARIKTAELEAEKKRLEQQIESEKAFDNRLNAALENLNKRFQAQIDQTSRPRYIQQS